MYKDKDRQREACRQAMQRKRQGITQTESVIPLDVIPNDEYAMLPPLPTDQLIAANKDIGWSDVMALDHAVINEVYHLATRYDEDVMLRLLRAAGYAKRMAA